MADLKHIGRIKTTGRKVLVAYRTLPGESDSALVIQTENLSDDQHDSLIRLVESPSAQSAYEFAEVLARGRFSDGSIMLSNLHITGRLTKVKTSEVEITPNLHTTISLDELNQLIAEQRGISVNDLAIGNQAQVQEVAQVHDLTKTQEVTSSETDKTTVANVTESAEVAPSFDTPEAEAKFYRSQADKLSKQAAEMRRKAEELAPTKKKATPAE